MDKRSSHTIRFTLITVGVIILSMAIFYLGGVIPIMPALLLAELSFNLVLIPRLVSAYYRLHDVDLTSKFRIFIPIYNSTMVMGELIAKFVYADFVLLMLVSLISFNTHLFSGLPDNYLLRVLSILPIVLFVLCFVLFVLVGVGLGGVSLKVRELHNLYFNSEDTSYGIYKVLSKVLSSSSFVEIVFFTIPVIRIIPLLLCLERVAELKSFNVTFNDFESDSQQNDYEGDY